MLGHHAVRDVLRPLVSVTAQFGHPGDNRAEDIVAVEVVHVLHDGGEALQAHAGVDVLERQVHQRRRAVGLRFLAVILREHVVPDFQKTRTLAGVGVVGPGVVAVLRSPVIEDLAAWAAGTVGAFFGRVGGPEVLVGPEAQDVVLGQANFLCPDVECLVVVLVNGGVQLGAVHAHPLRVSQEFPGPGQRFALEVVAKRKVAQHFQQRAVPQRASHVLNVADAQAFLGGGHALVRALLEAGGCAHELRLERLHARHGEQRRGIGGHRAGAGQAQVALALKKTEELLADLGGG
ncbi:hypothetical protein DESA109040_14705 [Deinococcus saxicola]